MVRFLGMLVWLTYLIMWCQKGGTTKHEDVNGAASMRWVSVGAVPITYPLAALKMNIHPKFPRVVQCRGTCLGVICLVLVFISKFSCGYYARLALALEIQVSVNFKFKFKDPAAL